MNEKSKLCTVKEAAEIAGVTTTTIRLYLRKGIFKSAHKIRGTRWMIDRDEVEELINGDIDISGMFQNA